MTESSSSTQEFNITEEMAEILSHLPANVDDLRNHLLHSDITIREVIALLNVFHVDYDATVESTMETLSRIQTIQLKKQLIAVFMEGISPIWDGIKANLIMMKGSTQSKSQASHDQKGKTRHISIKATKPTMIHLKLNKRGPRVTLSLKNPELAKTPAVEPKSIQIVQLQTPIQAARELLEEGKPFPPRDSMMFLSADEYNQLYQQYLDAHPEMRPVVPEESESVHLLRQLRTETNRTTRLLEQLIEAGAAFRNVVSGIDTSNRYVEQACQLLTQEANEIATIESADPDSQFIFSKVLERYAKLIDQS